MSNHSHNAHVLRLRRLINVPRDRVFLAWTDPQRFERWFRPLDTPVRVRQFDLRVGGAFRFELGTDLNPGGLITGVFLAIEPPEKLVLTWTSEATDRRETRVTVELVARDDATELILTHEQLATEATRRGHQMGWESALDHIPALV